MPRINVNVADAPDEILPIRPGKYTLEVVDVPEVGESKKGKAMLTISYKIADEGEFFGRRITDWIVFSMETRLKRACLACGVPFSDEGFDTEDFAGKECVGIIRSQVGKDEQTGEQFERAVLRDYVVVKDD